MGRPSALMMVEKKEVGMDLLMVASKEGKMVDSDDSMGGLKVVPMGFSMAAKWVAKAVSWAAW